jgi:hypothetical protein
MVLVEWEDITTSDAGTWEFVEDLGKPVSEKIFLSTGWIVRMTPEMIELTTCVEPDFTGLIAPRERIPRAAVRSIVELGLRGKPVALDRARWVKALTE